MLSLNPAVFYNTGSTLQASNFRSLNKQTGQRATRDQQKSSVTEYVDRQERCRAMGGGISSLWTHPLQRVGWGRHNRQIQRRLSVVESQIKSKRGGKSYHSVCRQETSCLASFDGDQGTGRRRRKGGHFSLKVVVREDHRQASLAVCRPCLGSLTIPRPRCRLPGFHPIP